MTIARDDLHKLWSLCIFWSPAIGSMLLLLLVGPLSVLAVSFFVAIHEMAHILIACAARQFVSVGYKAGVIYVFTKESFTFRDLPLMLSGVVVNLLTYPIFNVMYQVDLGFYVLASIATGIVDIYKSVKVLMGVFKRVGKVG